MRRMGTLILLPLLTFAVAACNTTAEASRGHGDRGLRLNDLQFLATHNSYHIEPEPKLFDALKAFLGDEANGFQYTHQPLTDELDAGVRQLELDTFVDTPEGGHYASPKLVPALGLDPVDPRLSEPGLKVIHVQEVDYRSTCVTFVRCLQEVEDWSDANPDHLPVVIQLEPKDDVIPDPGVGFVEPIPWSQSAMEQLDTEIASVFDEEQIITPADVKGRKPTLREAVERGRWPKLKDARGRVMFTLDNVGEERGFYRSLHPDVEDRTIFVAAAPPDDDAAVVVVNDPINEADRIKQLVDDGYMVRTRADADTVQARNGDTTMRDAAWASGAHWISTDYIVPDERFGTGYFVEVPGGGEARCNPVSAPKRCRL